MLRPGIALNEIPIKVSSKKIRPCLINHKTEDDDRELRKNRTNLSRRMFADRRTCPPKNKVSESFHCAMEPMLNLAQIFGVFPVSGLRSPSPNNLQFKKFSFLTFFSVSVIISILFVTSISMIFTLKHLNAPANQTHGGITEATAGTVFYGISLLAGILFFRLSSRWMSFQCEWRAMEHHMDSNCAESPRLRWKFFVISTTVLVLALIEHILSMVNNANNYEWDGSTNSTFSTFLKIYCLNSHPFIFEILEYNFGYGLYIFFISKLATFLWNFTDLFVMLVSTGLAERYKFLNKKVAATVLKDRLSFDWREIRKDFAMLSCVVKKVDDYISSIIFLSFANNLYFICLQLLNTLSRPNESDLVSGIYFFGSFAFLIGRTCFVTLCAASINVHSKEALPHLYNCPAATYNFEVQRLEYQLANDDVTLTGLRFFPITRNFMLVMAGAIMTYEIALLQFNNRSESRE